MSYSFCYPIKNLRDGNVALQVKHLKAPSQNKMSHVDKLKTFSRKQRPSKKATQLDDSKSNEMPSTGSQSQGYTDGVNAAIAQADPYDFLGTHADISADMQSRDSRGSIAFVF